MVKREFVVLVVVVLILGFMQTVSDGWFYDFINNLFGGGDDVQYSPERGIRDPFGSGGDSPLLDITPAFCVDSDGEDDGYGMRGKVRGFAREYGEDGDYYDYWDDCSSSNMYTVIERFCNSNGEVIPGYVDCTNVFFPEGICVDGACVKIPPGEEGVNWFYDQEELHNYYDFSCNKEPDDSVSEADPCVAAGINSNYGAIGEDYCIDTNDDGILDTVIDFFCRPVSGQPGTRGDIGMARCSVACMDGECVGSGYCANNGVIPC